MKDKKDLKIAIVCDSLDQYGGAEKIVEIIHEMYPKAPVYTSFYNAGRMTKHGFKDEGIQIITPRFGRNKYMLKYAKALVFLYPAIFERFDFSGYDLVISSSSRFAHGVITTADTIHICYMHSPSRYAWDYFQYRDSLHLGFFLRRIYPYIISYLRIWDRVAADRVDYFIANSRYTQQRIIKFYKRKSVVIHPFVDTLRFKILEKSDTNGYYIYIGRFIPLRKLEIVVDTFNKLGLSLHMVGNGDKKYIEKLKKRSNANITFFEKQSDDQVAKQLANSRALIWPGVEDFGIAPVEALAAGKPVIAFNRGGAKDIIEEGITGIFFDKQDSSSLYEAMQRFSQLKFDPEICISHAQRFKKEKFIATFGKYIDSIIDENSISA